MALDEYILRFVSQQVSSDALVKRILTRFEQVHSTPSIVVSRVLGWDQNGMRVQKQQKGERERDVIGMTS